MFSSVKRLAFALLCMLPAAVSAQAQIDDGQVEAEGCEDEENGIGIIFKVDHSYTIGDSHYVSLVVIVDDEEFGMLIESLKCKEGPRLAIIFGTNYKMWLTQETEGGDLVTGRLVPSGQPVVIVRAEKPKNQTSSGK